MTSLFFSIMLKVTYAHLLLGALRERQTRREAGTQSLWASLWGGSRATEQTEEGLGGSSLSERRRRGCAFDSSVITYHSFSQLILYPWGYAEKPAPDAFVGLNMAELAKQMRQLIYDVHSKTYTPQQSSQLYPTAGDTTDWTYGEYGIPSFTIKLQPDSVERGGFILPSEEIQPTFEENLPAAEHVTERLL